MELIKELARTLPFKNDQISDLHDMPGVTEGFSIFGPLNTDRLESCSWDDGAGESDGLTCSHFYCRWA